jgi:Putative MetA-pathway of phenol degradation
LAGHAIATAAIAAILASDITGVARAQEASATDNPPLSAICTDRPTKSSYACTVDAGHFQYESDVVNESYLRLDGATTRDWIIFNPTLKYGLTSDVDVEANISPLEIVSSRDKNGAHETLAGSGDLYLRLKYEFLNISGGNLQMAVVPYIKAPTARQGIGDGATEGGVLIPLNYKLTDTLTLTTVPEVDSFKDASTSGYHLNTVQLMTLGVSLPHGFNVYGELWGDWNFEPEGTLRECSADLAVTYGPTQYLQLDTGINFGLNRLTPAVQAYVGLSQKF